MVTWGHVTISKQNISSSERPMVTKLSVLVTYDEGNPSIIPNEPSD